MSHELFQQIFDRGTFAATAPFLALSIGICLLIAIELVPAIAAVRKPVFLASIAVAGWYAVQLLLNAGRSEQLFFANTYAGGTTTACWSLLFLLSTLIAWIYGQKYYVAESAFEAEHDILLLSSAAGMILMAGSRDLLVFFVGLELLSIPLYTLSAFRRSRRDSVEAGLKYFILGAFSAASYLFGAALVYAGTGTLTLSAMGAADIVRPLTIAGAAFVAASLFFKISVFPFHLWVPDVYQGAPSPVTTFMATGTKGAAFAFLLPVAFLMPPSATMIFGVIAVITMAAGNLGALVQTDMKRMLAYSGIAHAGTMLLGVAGWIAGGSQRDATSQAVLFYMAAYVFTAGGAFGLITMLESQTGKAVTLDSLKGLARTRPGTAAALAVFMLSLGGIPATGGFLGKYLVFSIAVRADLVWLCVLGVLMSVIALGYYLRVIVALYMQPATEPEGALPASRASASLATFVCAAVVLVLGLVPGWFLDHLR